MVLRCYLALGIGEVIGLVILYLTVTVWNQIRK